MTEYLENHEELGTHYLIGRSGAVVSSIPEMQVANHALGANSSSIGIELINRGDGRDSYSDTQIESLVSLLKEIQQRHGIPLDRIQGHTDVDARRFECAGASVKAKQDPGSNFPWEPVRRGLTEEIATVEETTEQGHSSPIWCLSFNSCLSKGVKLSRDSDKEGALPYVIRAIRIDPLGPNGWRWLGNVLFLLDRYAEAEEAFETFYELGGVGKAIMCLERWPAVNCDSGRLTLSGERIAFATEDGVKVFDAAPIDVQGVEQVDTNTSSDQTYSKLVIRLSGEKYSLVPTRVGDCEVEPDSYLCAPAGAIDQKQMVKYLARTIPRLSSRSVTLTVPGWIGWDSEHFRRFFRESYLEDYLAPYFGDAVPFPWTRTIRDTSSESAFRQSFYSELPNATVRLKTQLLTHVLNLEDRGGGVLNLEAHSWGGVIAYQALRELQGDSSFTTALESVELNFDTLGSPVGCLDPESPSRQFLPRQLGLDSGFLLAGLSHNEVALQQNSLTWRNYLIPGDYFACEVPVLGERNYVLEAPKALVLESDVAGSTVAAHSSPNLIELHGAYYEVPENLDQIVRNNGSEVSIVQRRTIEKIRDFAVAWGRCRPQGPGPIVHDGRSLLEDGDLAWSDSRGMNAGEIEDAGYSLCGIQPPRLDGWGNELEYVAVGPRTGGMPFTFGIRSAGSDGIFDSDYYDEGVVLLENDWVDIVYIYPTFWQFPVARSLDALSSGTLGSSRFEHAEAPFSEAIEVPKLVGRINDYAGVITDEREPNLEEKLKTFEALNGAQIAVLTIASLAGENLEDYSLRVASTWKLGRGDINNGVLLLVVRDDQRIRIEVGLGLEERLTNKLSAQILNDLVLPQVRLGSYTAAIELAVEAIITALRTGIPAATVGLKAIERR